MGVGQDFAAPIRRRAHGGLALAASDNLQMGMKDCHGRNLLS
jgi:hypothetical protein